MKIPTKNLTWYEKIDLTNKLIAGLIPEGYTGYEGEQQVPEKTLVNR
ncbi:MAG: hypothetical protein QNJ74_11095 [Trichodesmium sp. MO_231.B1]|nr:hypothetical protein [Trichodesmium sp. MO_231.B1]